MSQVTSPTTTLRSQVRDHRTVAVSALLALLATVAVVLVLVIDGGSSNTSSVAQRSQAALRSDGGPEESAVAGSLQAAKAEAIPGRTTLDGRPDESRTAAPNAGN